MNQHVLNGYAEDAGQLIPAFEAISSADVLAPVADLLPDGARHTLDIGAGTGRDAAWLAGRGGRILAVEPVAAFREAGRRLHPSPQIDWLDDSLPSLSNVRQRGESFDCILLIAVWHHLEPEQRQLAFDNIRRLSATGCRLILSLRHGPASPTRPGFPISVEETVDLARRSQFGLLANRAAASVQAGNRQAGVSWTWLVFEAV